MNGFFWILLLSLSLPDINSHSVPLADSSVPPYLDGLGLIGRASRLRGGGPARPDILLPIQEWKLAISEKLSKSSSIYSGKKGAKLSFYYLITMAVGLIFISV